MKKYIKNWEQIAISKERNDLLDIINSGYQSIDTREIIKNNFVLEDNILKIKNTEFNLNNFENIYLIGFGKASGVAIISINEILKDKIKSGLVMDKEYIKCEKIDSYICSHPRPSKENITPSEKLAKLAESLGEKDLAIVVVSGGGSAMLCYPETECPNGLILYEEFLKTGGNISELNTLRKHLSLLKGGGLAKLLYPATVIGLIFCDVPGDFFHEVASGPTYKDESGLEDVNHIIKKYNLNLNIKFTDTPKEDKYFEKVTNIPMVTNTYAVTAMEQKVKELGYEIIDEGANLYQKSEDIINLFINNAKNNCVIVGAGEPSIKLKYKGGKTGRNEYMSALAMEKIGENDIFASFASDGIDNISIASGAIVDKITKEKAQRLNLDISESINNNTVDEFFEKTEAQIITGETGSNVSDLMILLRK